MTAGPTKPGKRRAPQRTRLGVGDRAPEPPKMLGERVLGRYIVEAELGSGAMGTVYRAFDTNVERAVALKVMHDHLVDEPKLLERFHREAKIAGRLLHPNVAAVLDLGVTEDNKQVMVLELVDGTSLADLMTKPFAPPRALRYVAQLLRGLEHAHGAGLVHRDLKPDNVIVETADDGVETARIVDFGIATLVQREGEPLDRLTGTGMIVGTPLYMAPEQARAEAVDHRADLYALGMMLYEMLSGAAPFAGTAMEVAVAKMDRDPTPITTHVPELDRLLVAYLGRLVARDLARRFSSAREALDVLELVGTDREAAAAALGVIDVERAISIVWLPDPPT